PARAPLIAAHTCHPTPSLARLPADAIRPGTQLWRRPLDPRKQGKSQKTQVQARCRCHATRPAGPARGMRGEHEYDRGGALAYLAAWDVHHAHLFGRVEPTTGID